MGKVGAYIILLTDRTCWVLCYARAICSFVIRVIGTRAVLFDADGQVDNSYFDLVLTPK